MTKQVIIFVGGKGNRLYPLTKYMPKPLVNIHNKPFLFYLIQQLENFQFTEVILLTGYRSNKFITFKNNYQKYFNLKINIIKQPVEWQTAKRLFQIKKKINKYFYLLYGDNLVNLKKSYFKKKINKVIIQHKTLAEEKGNIQLKKNFIDKYDEDRIKNYSFVELGYFGFFKKDLNKFLINKNISFSKIIKEFINKKKLFFVKTSAKYCSITDQKRLKKTNELIKKYFLH